MCNNVMIKQFGIALRIKESKDVFAASLRSSLCVYISISMSDGVSLVGNISLVELQW